MIKWIKNSFKIKKFDSENLSKSKLEPLSLPIKPIIIATLNDKPAKNNITWSLKKYFLFKNNRKRAYQNYCIQRKYNY